MQKKEHLPANPDRCLSCAGRTKRPPRQRAGRSSGYTQAGPDTGPIASFNLDYPSRIIPLHHTPEAPFRYHVEKNIPYFVRFVNIPPEIPMMRRPAGADACRASHVRHCEAPAGPWQSAPFPRENGFPRLCIPARNDRPVPDKHPAGQRPPRPQGQISSARRPAGADARKVPMFVIARPEGPWQSAPFPSDYAFPACFAGYRLPAVLPACSERPDCAGQTPRRSTTTAPVGADAHIRPLAQGQQVPP